VAPLQAEKTGAKGLQRACGYSAGLSPRYMAANSAWVKVVTHAEGCQMVAFCTRQPPT